MAGDADGETVASSTEEFHERSWSRNLETPAYAGERESIVADAVDAIERTASGTHVNLVTHGDCGHPREYLFSALVEQFGDAVEWEFVERCGCGGYVTRVFV